MSKHSDSHDAVNAFQACLSFLPSSSTERILEQLKQSIDYEPVIGIMGKTGAGKSSLCNALFQEQTCLTSELMACTREPQRLILTVGEHSITLVDLPGVGETPEFDAEYMALYHRLFVELDLVIWVLRADDRARAIDITTHRLLLSNGADPSRFLFVITQAECIPPLPTNSECQERPSPTQCLSLATISAQIAGQFPSSYPVIAVSAHTGYNLTVLVELMVHALPIQASSAFYRQLKPEHLTKESNDAVRQRFGEMAGNAFDTVINPDSFPSGWTSFLRKLRQKLVQLATVLWDRVFG